MASKRTYKCAICNELITDGTEIPYKKNRYVHTKCFNISIKAIQKNKSDQLKDKKKNNPSKPKSELKDALSEEEYNDKKELYDYLRNDLFVEPNVKIYTLVERYRTIYNCTYKGIRLTLIYLKEVSGKELIGDVVGIVPFYYDEAKKWYENLKKIEQSNEKVSTKYEEKIVKIKRPSSIRKKEIDINDV